eukprot:CAMPEP_0202389064 /NCGR_PEP_ID=MMETSP1127-20130417/80959_1 /ASSEMBLY_ACC=CAM_ASM_000462 /TAXON_ID=3047 /ORGANISM="Dunaliella tertiolecta, Strain CCMP1320" /LENGTH=154 /DNA_ID=CAMNT_0048990703 /DNA_START=57 /DNA_END=521 /DNA_ORIENTATION=+
MRVWALQMGPYGKALALTWEVHKDAMIVEVGSGEGRAAWVVPGLQQRYPHDVALTAAPTALTGAAERLFALLVAPVCGPPGCGPLLKYVLVPVDYQLPKNFDGGSKGEGIVSKVSPVMPAGWRELRWGRPAFILVPAAVLGLGVTLAARQALRN